MNISEEELKKKLDSFGKWMYRFDFTERVTTPLISEEFLKVHETRKKMIFSWLDRVYEGRWNEVDCLDIACNEGFYSIEIARRGAKRVLGFDARQVNIEKANFIKNYFGYNNVEFFKADIETLGTKKHGKFEIVLLLGLLYHVENPMLVLRKARELTSARCIIDTQITRFNSKIEMGFGCTGFDRETLDSIGIIEESNYKDDITASVTGLSFIPNKSALLTMLRHAGFSDVKVIEPFSDSYEQYRNFDRLILIAK